MLARRNDSASVKMNRRLNAKGLSASKKPFMRPWPMNQGLSRKRSGRFANAGGVAEIPSYRQVLCNRTQERVQLRLFG